MPVTAERDPQARGHSRPMRPRAAALPFLLFGLAVAIVTVLALVVAPSAGAAGGCGGG